MGDVAHDCLCKAARGHADVSYITGLQWKRAACLCAGLSALDGMIRGSLFYLLSNRHSDYDELEAGSGLPRVRDAHRRPGFFKQCLYSQCSVARPLQRKEKKKKNWIRKQFVPIFSAITVHFFFFLRQARKRLIPHHYGTSSCFGKLASSGSEFLGGILFLSLSAAVAARRLGSTGCPGL